MNNVTKIAMALSMALILSICAVSLIPQESEATDSSTTLTTGTDITDNLRNVSSDTNLTINLQAGGSYTLTGVGFGGASLTINGNGATVVVSNTDNYAAWINSSYGGSVIIDGVNFKVTDNSSSYKSCILYFAYFDDATVTNCNFDSIQLGLTTNTNKAPMDATVMNCHWSIAEGSKVFKGYYALNLAILDDVMVSGCTFTGYDRGMNIQLEGTGSSAYVKNCTFTSIGGKCALQLSGDVGYANASFSGCTFSGCKTAVSIHESAKGDGSVLSYDNDYSSCETLLLYSADSSNQTSSVGFTSNDDSVNDITTPIGAEGTATPPINTISGSEWYSDLTIRTKADLREFAQMVNYGNDFKGQTILLEASIVLKSDDWTPIGHGSRSGTSYTEDSTPFRGIFNGQGNIISNLTIISTTGAEDPIGLFGIVDGGTISNLYLSAVSINVATSEMAGSVAGMLCGGATVSDCTVSSGSVSVLDSAGGIVGKVFSNGTITGCTNYAMVTTVSGNTGGIVGASYYKPTTDTGLVISGCTNNGAVTSSAGYTGGIVGLSSANISGCTNNGDVNACGASVGGIVGTQKNAGTISGCTNNGIVTNGTSSSTAGYGTGGIVGWTNYLGDGNFGESDLTQIVVTDCHNHADVTTNYTGAGGIVGITYHGVTVENCTSGINSDDTTVTITGDLMVGGIVGGVQSEPDAKHVHGGCHIWIVGNKCDGIISNPDSTTNTGNLCGQVLSTSSDPTCTMIHGSFATILNNEVNTTGGTADVVGGGDTVAYIVFDGVEYGYPTLAKAIENAGEGSVIVLVQNISEQTPILSEKTIVLDLNGNELSSNGTTITNKGTLTIKDDSDEKNGTVTSVSTGPYVVVNEGTLTLESGNITRITTTSSQAPGYVIDNSGDLHIDGGTVSASTYESSLIRSFGSTSSPATITISGGTIVQSNGGIAVKNDEYSTLTITDGVIEAHDTNSDPQAVQNWTTAIISGGKMIGAVAGWDYDDNSGHSVTTITGDAEVNGNVYGAKYTLVSSELSSIPDPSVLITGGTVTGELMTVYGTHSTNTVALNPSEGDSEQYAWIEVTGGTFTNEVESRFLADNYELAGDGPYYVTYDPEQGVVSIGDVYFPTLQDAFDTAADGDTINLNKSVSIDTAITLNDGRSLTLNLGDGFNIESSASAAIIIEHGSLNIQGRGTISIPVTGSGAVAISGSTDPSAVDYSVLTVGEEVTLRGYFGLLVQEKIVDKNRVVGSAYGVRVEIYGTAIGLTDNITDGDWHGAALDVNGNIHGLSGNLPVINIHSSAVITGTDDALGIYGAGQAVWNVYGATITGSTGIEIRNGTLNIESGTVTSTASDYVVIQNGSGRTTTGAAIAITPYYSAGEDTIHISIGNGTFTGPVSFSQSNINGVTGPGYDIEIKGGTFTSTGMGADGRYSAIVTADSIGTFVSGGTFSSDVTAYCDEGFKPIYNGTSYVVQAVHTVTFDYNGGIQVVVLDGDTVDVPDLPVREGYSYRFTVDDTEWDFSTPITQDIEIDVTEYISDIVVNVTFGTDSAGNVTFTATATSSIVQDFTYVWHYEGDDDYEYEGATITNLGPGGYSVTATAVDSDGIIGTRTCIFTYRQALPDDPSDIPVENVDITHSGQQLDKITVNSGTIVVTSNGDHSDIDMSFDFDDGVVENAPTIEISGNVGTGVITITVTDLSSDSSAVVDRIVEDVNSSVTTDVTTEDVVSVDVSLDNVTSLERMIIKIPMGEVGKYVASGQAYYITESGSYVSVPSSIQGDEVWIYTDHNTPYVYIATSYASTMTFEDEPDLGTDEPDITPPIFIPDDDDPVIPPTIVVDESSSDDGEAVKIAACVAAAVAAAIMALILVAEYRKR